MFRASLLLAAMGLLAACSTPGASSTVVQSCSYSHDIAVNGKVVAFYRTHFTAAEESELIKGIPGFTEPDSKCWYISKDTNRLALVGEMIRQGFNSVHMFQSSNGKWVYLESVREPRLEFLSMTRPNQPLHHDAHGALALLAHHVRG
jgi:hypothetical protein